MIAPAASLRGICAALIATALIHAPFASADAKMIAVSNCNGGMGLLVIPQDGDSPGKGGGKGGGNDCAKACHGMCERRGKAASKRIAPPR